MRRDPSIPPTHALTISVVCLVLGLICVALILSGCADSPTAPSVTTTLSWGAAPGCAPAPNPPKPTGPLDLSGTVGGIAVAIWTVDGVTYQASFQQLIVPGYYGLCAWQRVN